MWQWTRFVSPGVIVQINICVLNYVGVLIFVVDHCLPHVICRVEVGQCSGRPLVVTVLRAQSFYAQPWFGGRKASYGWLETRIVNWFGEAGSRGEELGLCVQLSLSRIFPCPVLRSLFSVSFKCHYISCYLAWMFDLNPFARVCIHIALLVGNTFARVLYFP